MMRRLGRIAGWALSALVLIVAGLWLFGPVEPVDLNATFEPRRFGEGVQVYFETVESRFDDITPGTEKRVIWQPGFEERRTPVSVLYIHGFSATSEELRPVADRVADALGANLVYTRLQGHGRDGAAMATATATGWMQDTAEALAAARAVGDRVVVISTSTGGTLAAAAALDPELSRSVSAMIFVSPNFGINRRGAGLLTFPAARYWLPLVTGRTRSFETDNPAEARYWTLSYPWVAVLPMAALVKAVVARDFSQTRIPALFWICDCDRTVRPDITRGIAARWGGPMVLHAVQPGPGMDSGGHVIAGDIMSPGQTDPAVQGMLAWLHEIGI